MSKFERFFIRRNEPYLNEDSEHGLRLFTIEFGNENVENSNTKPNEPDLSDLPEKKTFPISWTYLSGNQK